MFVERHLTLVGVAARERESCTTEALPTGPTESAHDDCGALERAFASEAGAARAVRRGAEQLAADAFAVLLIAVIAGGVVALNGGAAAGLIVAGCLAAGVVILLVAGRRQLADSRAGIDPAGRPRRWHAPVSPAAEDAADAR